MKRRLVAMAMAGVLLFNVTPALAAEMPAPGGGPAFGKHISTMARDPGKTMGTNFGTHVSIMARGGDCAQ